jgi:hypothetical protein
MIHLLRLEISLILMPQFLLVRRLDLLPISEVDEKFKFLEFITG